MGGKLDGGGAHLPLRALGRSRLGPGAARDQHEFLVAAVALWRLEEAAIAQPPREAYELARRASHEHFTLKFPDGAERSYDDGVTPLAVAEGISKSLAKKVVAAKIDGAWWDLTRPLEGGGKFELVMRDSADGLEVLRHDAAHVLAQAVQELFPGTQVTFGPVTEDGFYYDFARDEPFSTDDFEKIEKRMKRDRRRRSADHPQGLGEGRRRSRTSSRSAKSTRPRRSTK